MRQFTKIVETTIIDDTGEEKTTRKTFETGRKAGSSAFHSGQSVQTDALLLDHAV